MLSNKQPGGVDLEAKVSDFHVTVNIISNYFLNFGPPIKIFFVYCSRAMSLVFGNLIPQSTTSMLLGSAVL